MILSSSTSSFSNSGKDMDPRKMSTNLLPRSPTAFYQRQRLPTSQRQSMKPTVLKESQCLRDWLKCGIQLDEVGRDLDRIGYEKHQNLS